VGCWVSDTSTNTSSTRATTGCLRNVDTSLPQEAMAGASAAWQRQQGEA
jgi:hypothetical protein